ncbi:MAG: hypothetical protein JWR69_4500, partial [Pedosphaera sp.]|nr:hypothetical protein [Pedosphaera sp.]
PKIKTDSNNRDKEPWDSKAGMAMPPRPPDSIDQHLNYCTWTR